MTNNSIPLNILGASSGVALATKAGNLYAIVGYLGTSDELTIYDNATEASGTVLFYAKGGNLDADMKNCQFKKGMWAVQTGTGSKTVILCNG